ncbi:14192_t:CDS:2, partial [Racocetra fulgida]
LLNALVFSQDIAVTRAFQDIKLHWWITNVNSYESHYPHRSHNKSVTDEFNMLGRSNGIIELQPLNCNNADINKSDIINDHDITLNNQKNDQDVHLVYPEPAHLKDPSQYSSLDLPSHYLNLSTSSDPLIGIDISTRAVGDDEQATSEDLNKIFSSSQEIEMNWDLNVFQKLKFQTSFANLGYVPITNAYAFNCE